MECSDHERDLLGSVANEALTEQLTAAGDDTLHFSCRGRYLYKSYDVVEHGAVVLTDQAIALVVDSAVQHRIECTSVLDLFRFQDGHFICAATDEADLLFKADETDHLDLFLSAFTEEVLPLEVTVVPTAVDYAAEKGLSSKVCGEFGLGEVKVVQKETALQALEREREERIQRDKERREEEEQRAAQAKEELKRRMEEDKASAEEAHRLGMRRLSLKRRNAESIDIALRKRRMQGELSRPSWWEGEWSEEVDPYIIEEARLDTMKRNMEQEVLARQQERLKRVMVLLGQVEREEGHSRRVLEGEYRMEQGAIREDMNLAMASLQRNLRKLREKVAALASQLVRDEEPARLSIEADEEVARKKYSHMQAQTATRVGGVSRLLRATQHDETRIRDEIAKLESKHFKEVASRWAKSKEKATHKAARKEREREKEQQTKDEDTVARSLQLRTLSLRKRTKHLASLSPRGTRQTRQTLLSPVSLMSTSDSHDEYHTSEGSLGSAAHPRLDTSTASEASLSDSCTPHSLSLSPRTTPPVSTSASPVGSPRLAHKYHSLRSASPNIRVPSPLPTSPSRHEPTPFPEGVPPPPPPPEPPEAFAQFAAKRLSQFDTWRSALKRELGLPGFFETTPGKAVFTAAACIVALSTPSHLPCFVREASVDPRSATPTRSKWGHGRVAIHPTWGQSVVLAYQPLCRPPTRSTFSTRSPSHTDLREPSPSPNSWCTASHSSYDPPAYRGPSVGSWYEPPPKYKSPSPRRNPSPIRGGGALCGSLCVRQQNALAQ
eukprot:Sspe_Gene.106646::Locus_84723_Transcript_1_1_Confidence_1.000_Length_2601::g.106646::m.106646